MPPLTLRASQPVVAPGLIATTSLDVRDAHESFDQLRAAMEDEDANLFMPLQVALADLVKVGRSLEVPTCCVM